MAKAFPAFHRLNGARVVIAGGGELAARKARLVFGEGVDLRIIWPCFEAGLWNEWSARAQMIDRAPGADDFDGASLAFIAVEDEVEARRLGGLARAAGVPTNVVDIPDASDFFTPSIIDRGDVVVAVSTAGAAPVLGRRIRAQVEALLPTRIGALAAFARSFRAAVAAKIAPPARRAFWERVFDGGVAEAFLAGDEAGAREKMLAAVNTTSSDDLPRGVVHIVGAGPGDPELLTLRALRLIQNADVILYDRLVGGGVLDLARRDAERIFVGKAKADHAVQQEDIEAMMIALARDGKTVVRLKGGDPFVFGRGGEELDAMRAAGVEAYVTPGVTAAIGCGARAGLPLTHRDHSQAVTFVTGHAKGDADPDLDWASLARLNQTLVVYMGVEKAGVIAGRLISNGLDPLTPAAVIEKGTLPDEKILVGTIQSMPDLIAEEDVKGPALLVVGATAALAQATANPAPHLQRLSA
ncbi:MAG: siroheme synthase CysG [Pseudomonadota bacterium]